MMKTYEKKYANCQLICGIDEVGRGPLAGPVVAGAVILPKDCNILYLNDSKQLSEKKREELYEVIMQEAVSFNMYWSTISFIIGKVILWIFLVILYHHSTRESSVL